MILLLPRKKRRREEKKKEESQLQHKDRDRFKAQGSRVETGDIPSLPQVEEFLYSSTQGKRQPKTSRRISSMSILSRETAFGSLD